MLALRDGKMRDPCLHGPCYTRRDRLSSNCAAMVRRKLFGSQTPWITLVKSRFHLSYERGCQEKRLLPAPRRDAGVVTYVQPRLILARVIGPAASARRRLQRRCQPQLLVPTPRFHEVVVLDAIRFRSYASEGLAQVPTMILCETRGLQLFWVIRGGIGLTRRRGAKLQHTERLISVSILSLEPEHRKNRLATTEA